jgi:cell wall assembly regulator SMI1
MIRLTGVCAADKIRSVGELTAAWLEYMDLLAQVAPTTHAAIQPPARATDRLPSELGVDLNDELREWFGLHDGAGYEWSGQVLPMNFLIGVAEAIELTAMTREIWSEFDDDRELAAAAEEAPAGTVARTWLPQYVYIGNDSMGGGFFVDLRSGPLQGCVRNWDKTEADDNFGEGPVTTDLASLIKAVHGSLRAGERAEGLPYRAVVEDGQLSWAGGEE